MFSVSCNGAPASPPAEQGASRSPFLRAAGRRLLSRRDAGVPLLILLIAFVSCRREERRFHEPPSAQARSAATRLVSLAPGPHTPDVHVPSPYNDNAFAISEGKRLFGWYNCVGCHSHGGGGMGPPLMDDNWIYGSDPENIFATIVEGRPNGMPSFRGRIPEGQAWQLVAYVRSMSGLGSKQAAPNRADAMEGAPPENRRSPW